MSGPSTLIEPYVVGVVRMLQREGHSRGSVDIDSLAARRLEAITRVYDFVRGGCPVCSSERASAFDHDAPASTTTPPAANRA